MDNEALKREYTSDEFLSINGLEGRYELVSGELYAMLPSPNLLHQKISGGLYWRIRSYIEENKGKCTVLAAPSDVKLDDKNTVQPDIFVVCDSEKFDEHGCNGAPDWVIEILSPYDPTHDTVEKLALYSSAGVREYWIVDPMSQKVLVYPFEEGSSVGIFTFDDDIKAGIYKSSVSPLTICVNKLI